MGDKQKRLKPMLSGEKFPKLLTYQGLINLSCSSLHPSHIILSKILLKTPLIDNEYGVKILGLKNIIMKAKFHLCRSNR